MRKVYPLMSKMSKQSSAENKRKIIQAVYITSLLYGSDKADTKPAEEDISFSKQYVDANSQI